MRSARRCDANDGSWRAHFATVSARGPPRTRRRTSGARRRSGSGAPARRRGPPLSPSVLDEGNGVARVLLLLLDRFLFLRRVLRLLLAFLRGLMGHGPLLWVARTWRPVTIGESPLLRRS